MTVQAAAVEQQLGRPLMPRFFAAFSLGTFAGAAVGVMMIALQVPVSIHAAAVAAVIAAAIPAAARHFLPEQTAPRIPAPSTVKDRRPGLDAWREPRTVAVGLVALAFAVAEGAGSNWVSVSVIDRHHLSPTIGTLAYASFLAALTAGRWFGPAVLDRFGRVAVLRIAAGAAGAGVALFALGPSTGAAFAGTLLWGMGAALGFPVSMSAGADEPVRAASRVGVITSIGYCGFVGGPPLIGFLGDRTGVAHALLVITIFMALATAIAGATHRIPDKRVRTGSDPHARTAVM
jgi:predicted MFS family arabinose efflux permease